MAIQIKKKLEIPEENYVYFHHTNTHIIIPVDPDSISDETNASFASNTPLSRSAPIYSYQNSGPRSVGVNFTLHRDLCNQFNNLGYDAVEALITNLDQMVLPDYNSAGKIVNPPVVSLKLRDDIFIKGIVTHCSHTYQLPIINYFGKNRYAVVGLNFGVQEVTPYSASIIPSVGQYRNTSGISYTSGTTNNNTNNTSSGIAQSIANNISGANLGIRQAASEVANTSNSGNIFSNIPSVVNRFTTARNAEVQRVQQFFR